jgi:hypothetical protein
LSSPLEAFAATLFTLTPLVPLNLPMSPPQSYTVGYTDQFDRTQSMAVLATSRRHAINSVIELNPGVTAITAVTLTPEF